MTLPELLIFKCKREVRRVCIYTVEDVPFSWVELRGLLGELRMEVAYVGILESSRAFLFRYSADDVVEWEL